MDAQICSYVEVNKNFILFKSMPFRDDPPHRFSQFMLFLFYKQDWKISFYTYLREVVRCNSVSL